MRQSEVFGRSAAWLTLATVTVAVTMAYWGWVAEESEAMVVTGRGEYGVMEVGGPWDVLRVWLREVYEQPRLVVNLLREVRRTTLGRPALGLDLLSLVLHVVAAMLVYGIAWRTLESEGVGEELYERSLWLGSMVAVLWAVHPVHTEVLLSGVGRKEVMAGTAVLWTVYCGMRSEQSERRGWWYGGAVVGQVVAMMATRAAVVVPVAFLIHEAVARHQGYWESVWEKWRLYASLVMGAVLCEAMWWLKGGGSGRMVFVGSWDEARRCAEIVLRYVWLSVVPHPLIHGCEWPTRMATAPAWRTAIIAAMLLTVTGWGLIRKRWSGVVGAWFGLWVVARTVAVREPELAYQEARMYVAVAAITGVLVVGLDWVGRLADKWCVQVDGWRIIPAAVVVGVVVIYMRLTMARGEVYRDEALLALDAAEKQQVNWAKYNMAGDLFSAQGLWLRATSCYAHALALQPTSTNLWEKLSAAQSALGDHEGAVKTLRKGAEVVGADVHFLLKVAELYERMGQTNAARRTYEELLVRHRGHREAEQRLAMLPEVRERGRVITGVRSGWRLRRGSVPPWRREGMRPRWRIQRVGGETGSFHRVRR